MNDLNHDFKIRRSNERGLADHGWLKSRHSFSFAGYYDPLHMNFGPLRVINEDQILGGQGFDTHPHSDMEIISYVVSGALKHEDSMGNKTVILPGEVQRMSAGTGIRHSEYNQDENKSAHFLQIWIIPNRRGVKPSYGQKSFEKELNSQKFVHVISPNGSNGSISIHQDANVYASRLKPQDQFALNIGANRKVWVQVIKGEISVNGHELKSGDAASSEFIERAEFKAHLESEFLVFDLP